MRQSVPGSVAPMTEPDGLDDHCLLSRIGDGDRLAFRCLMSRHAALMLSLAERTTGSIDEADEIVQDAFLKVWTLAPKWRADGGAAFSTWLYRVVLNACLDFRRRRPLQPLEAAGDPPCDRPGAFDCALASQRAALVRAAMADLPERQQAALSLHYFSDLSAPQAAQVLEVSLSAFESLLVRGRKALLAALAARGLTRIEDMV